MISSAILLSLLPLLASAAPLSGRQVAGGYLQTGSTPLCLVAATNTVGAPVNKVDCSTLTSGQGLWTYIKGGNNPNGISITGTNLCLDAGSNPGNNVPLKVWTCYPGLTQQTWWYTDDLRIAITGGNQCLDSGPSASAGSQIQTYQCTPGNTNQIFVPSGSIVPPTTTATATATATTTAAPTTTTSVATTTASSTSVAPPPPASTGVHITFGGDNTKCLTVMNGFAGDGTIVAIAACSLSMNNTYDNFQRWNIVSGASSVVQLTNTPYCLDSSSFPGVSGTQLKIWTCNAGNPNQQWYYTADKHIALTGGTQCVDVVRDSTPINAKPYGSLQSLQTWQCGTDPLQIFTTDVGQNL